MDKLKLLDLFCGEGGAGMGYMRAGFEVTGVDIQPQPRYPGTFVQADALEYLAENYWRYDVIHASPPCQAHTRLATIWRARGVDWESKHPDFVPAVRAVLRSCEKPYVIENLETTPMINPVTLCGAMFGLKVYRHRRFEFGWLTNLILTPAHVPHRDNCPAVGKGMSGKGFISVSGHGGFGLGPGGLDYARRAMGCEWMSRLGLSQAIPPAYTEFIGKAMMTWLTPPF